jgi:hypothetical protein
MRELCTLRFGYCRGMFLFVKENCGVHVFGIAVGVTRVEGLVYRGIFNIFMPCTSIRYDQGLLAN